MGFDISSFQRMVIEIAISKFTRNSEVQETDQRLKSKLNFICVQQTLSITSIQ